MSKLSVPQQTKHVAAPLVLLRPMSRPTHNTGCWDDYRVPLYKTSWQHCKVSITLARNNPDSGPPRQQATHREVCTHMHAQGATRPRPSQRASQQVSAVLHHKHPDTSMHGFMPCMQLCLFLDKRMVQPDKHHPGGRWFRTHHMAMGKTPTGVCSCVPAG